VTLTLTDELLERFALRIEPHPIPSFPDWADANVWLRRDGRKVRWSTARTPYLREPMLALSLESPVREIVSMKCSQVGWSEMFNAFCAYRIRYRPTGILFLQPDLDAAKRYSQSRLGPVLEDCPALEGLIAEAKSRDSGNTIHTKTYGGNALDILGGNSPAGMASKSAGVVLIDEWDRMALGAGVGGRSEGDQYELAKNRTITHPRHKIVAASTPGDQSTSRIEPAWLASDRRRYHLPCPLCDARILLEFKRLWWPGKDSTKGETSKAVYICQACDGAINERHKPGMLAAGLWVPEQPEQLVRGYKINGLYSPFPGLAWPEIADRWQKAKGRPGRLRVFRNNVEGETYDMHAETRVQSHRLASLRVTLPIIDGQTVVPRGVGILTAGVDVQHNRLEIGVYGWGRGEECWHLEHRVIFGDPSGDAVWADLDEYLLQAWPTESGARLNLQAVCVDTGYETHRVYEFVRTRGYRCVWGIKGAKGGSGRRIWPKKPGRSSYRKTEFYMVGVDTAKTHIYARLKASVDARASSAPRGIGQIHIAEHIADDEHLEQLVAEVPVTKPINGHPRIVWDLPDGKRNEALDVAVYGYAALLALKAKGRRLDAAVAGVDDAIREPRSPAPEKIDAPSRSAPAARLDATPKAEQSPAPVGRPAPPAAPTGNRVRPPPRGQRVHAKPYPGEG
jgi:phage terminase large subunit GpA-like protein